MQIDLAYDPRASFTGMNAAAPSGGATVVTPRSEPRPVEVRPAAHALVGHSDAADARLLADYGKSPSHWLLAPFYTLKVFRRRRELRRALALRKEEATRAAVEAEDALVATAEHIRGAVDQEPDFSDVSGELRRAEELLHMRDRVLSAENEAEMARLASADARLSRLEGDLATAQREERDTAAELVAAQESLAREEAHLKRAESELRAAQREPGEARE
jgi:hypothetical protein